MEVRQLQYFLAVEETRNFTRASTQLHMSQSALSEAIAAFERSLGGPLFVRRSRGLDLTNTGEALLQPARRAVRAVQDAQQAVAEVDELRSGRLMVTAPPALLTVPMAELVGEFTRAHPGVRVEIQEAFDSKDAMDRVNDGRAEIALMDLSAARKGFRSIELVTYAILFASFDDSAPSLPDPIDVETVACLPMVSSPAGTGVRALIDGFDISTTLRIETRSVESILEHALRSRVQALMIEPYADKARAMGARVSRLDPPQSRTIGLTAAQEGVSKAAQRFLQLSAEYFGPAPARP